MADDDVDEAVATEIANQLVRITNYAQASGVSGATVAAALAAVCGRLCEDENAVVWFAQAIAAQYEHDVTTKGEH